MNINFTNRIVATSQGNIALHDSGGSGHPLVFIHGNSASKEFFTNQINSPLLKEYRIIAIDLPGHGDSDKASNPEETYSFVGYARVVKQVMKAMELVKPAIVGWSLGGHIGLELLRVTDKISGLLITGTPPINVSKEGFQQGFLPLPLFETLFTKIEFTKEDATQFMAGAGFDTEKYDFIVAAAIKTDGYARHHLAQSMFIGVGGDQKSLVESNNTSLCVIQGENDPGINNDYVVNQVNYKNLFGGKVNIVPKAQHAAFFDNPEAFNQIAASFFAEVFRS